MELNYTCNIPDDLYSVFDATKESFSDLVIKAQQQAVREGIEANSIIINKNMVRIDEFPLRTVNGGAVIMPKMICGLNVYLTEKELPANYSFALVHGPETRLSEFESIGMEPSELRKAAEIYKAIKERL